MYQIVIAAIAIICILASIIITARNYLSTKHTIEHMNHMLDRAMNGIFSVEEIDESMLSALEFKLAHYLDASTFSAKNVALEKEHIQMFLSDISHQTKTPLANILLYSQILQEKETDPALLPIVENIREQSEKLDFLIRSLVKASRLESDVLILQPKKQPLLPCILAAADAAREGAAKKQIEIVVEETDAAACFDRKWTEEAVGNLIDNAVKYSPVNSKIQVSVKEYEMFAAVQVADWGIGIREEEQAQIFDRFYRSREVAEEKGVGIGLYLVREIATRQGGYVKVQSNHGKGSVFSFYIAK